MPEFEIVDVPEPLLRALSECGKRYHLIRNQRMLAQTIARLIEPPASLQIPTPTRTALPNSLLNAVVPFDPDAAARMLRFDKGHPDPDAKWKALSRAERKRAKRLWTWALDVTLDTAPQGRPHRIDAALVLYCARVVAEGCGQIRFKLSKPPLGGPPGGPMWRALMAALPLAQCFLASAEAPAREGRGNRAETIADILKTARSKQFDSCCRELGIGTSANDVANNPGKFRLALTRARALRMHAGRK
jgi:hypothetical protein